jgi:hypothetical protein
MTARRTTVAEIGKNGVVLNEHEQAIYNAAVAATSDWGVHGIESITRKIDDGDIEYEIVFDNRYTHILVSADESRIIQHWDGPCE